MRRTFLADRARTPSRPVCVRHPGPSRVRHPGPARTPSRPCAYPLPVLRVRHPGGSMRKGPDAWGPARVRHPGPGPGEQVGAGSVRDPRARIRSRWARRGAGQALQVRCAYAIPVLARIPSRCAGPREAGPGWCEGPSMRVGAGGGAARAPAPPPDARTRSRCLCLSHPGPVAPPSARRGRLGCRTHTRPGRVRRPGGAEAAAPRGRVRHPGRRTPRGAHWWQVLPVPPARAARA